MGRMPSLLGYIEAQRENQGSGYAIGKSPADLTVRLLTAPYIPSVAALTFCVYDIMLSSGKEVIIIIIDHANLCLC